MDMGGRQQCVHRRPWRVPRPSRFARRAGGAARRLGACRIASAAATIPAAPCRRRFTLQPGEETEIVLAPRTGCVESRRSGLDQALSRPRSGCGIARRHRLLGAHARSPSGADARPVDGRAAERLAALSNVGLPHVGAHRLLSVERRLRVSRSAAGRDGALRRAAIGRARAHSARGVAPVRGRRRAALVAARHPVRASRRGYRTTGSGCRSSSHTISRSPGTPPCSMRRVRLSRGRPARGRPAGTLFGSRGHGRDGIAVRTLRPRARFQPRHRLARSAAVRHGRLERRHESGGRAAGRGESVWLGWFLHATLHALRADRRRRAATPPRRPRGASMPLPCSRPSSARPGTADWYRRGYFDDGTPLGSVASEECRIDSIAQSWARDQRRGRAGAGAARDVGGQRAARQPQRGPGAAVHPAVRSQRARSRLHQGLSARTARERRAIHPRRPVGDARVRACSATAIGRANCCP